jgi:hypothetical protein
VFRTKPRGILVGRATAQAVSRWLSPRRPEFDLRSTHVGFVGEKAALEQDSSE